ncbi:MAG: pilus (MSHA type) biogenesis protein MshL [Gammaproteobacteria bacterium]|nr:pilus (MSHA type) biogenesis protein MshL [Gammaproteobacteria bacterium]
MKSGCYFIGRVQRYALNVIIYGLLLILTACGANRIDPPTEGHVGLTAASAKENNTALPLVITPTLAAPQLGNKPGVYTVTVTDVPVRDLLFSLARNSQMNLDVHDDIRGRITLNAIEQTLPQILSRIAQQSNIRYRINDDTIIISADAPYFETYKIPYLNTSRETESRIEVSTEIAAASQGGVGGVSNSQGGNNSMLRLTNRSSNQFWETLFSNIAVIINEKNITQNAARPLSSDNILVNREAGLLSVRANAKQQEQIRVLIENILTSVQRQVLIEATVVEVNLNNEYEAGVNWERLAQSANGLSYQQVFTKNAIAPNNVPPIFVAGYDNPNSRVGDVAATVSLLEEFGDARVLSSPKIMTLNNQTAILKVADNRVYFTIEAETVTQSNGPAVSTFTTTPHVVPVGLVMSMTPFISEKDEVVLNIRPTISRILGFVKDPNPDLAKQNVENLVPEVQVREMESVLRLTNGEIGVIGGLMQDTVSTTTQGIPWISNWPVIGRFFQHRSEKNTKTELVIFLKPIVVQQASINGELKEFRHQLPANVMPAKAAQQ